MQIHGNSVARKSPRPRCAAQSAAPEEPMTPLGAPTGGASRPGYPPTSDRPPPVLRPLRRRTGSPSLGPLKAP